MGQAASLYITDTAVFYCVKEGRDLKGGVKLKMKIGIIYSLLLKSLVEHKNEKSVFWPYNECQLGP